MLLTCPSCNSKYLVNSADLKPNGRTVCCVKCRFDWYQAPDIYEEEKESINKTVPHTPNLDSNTNKNQKLSVLDIGTGSGCIIISILKDRPNFKGTAIDVCKNALNVAKYNAKIHQLENRIKFYKSSVDNFFKDKYDLVISNPPYINKFDLKYLERDVIGFEPSLALEGGIDGFTVLKKVIKKTSRLLKIGGKLVLEIGFDQKLKVIKLLKKEKYFVNKIAKDYGNRDRCVICTKL